MNYCPRTGKVSHASQGAAASGAGRHSKPRVYRCPYCAGWHVTHHRSELKPQKKWAKLAFGDEKK